MLLKSRRFVSSLGCVLVLLHVCARVCAHSKRLIGRKVSSVYLLVMTQLDDVAHVGCFPFSLSG